MLEGVVAWGAWWLHAKKEITGEKKKRLGRKEARRDQLRESLGEQREEW